jgi:hypothetical protein
MPPPPAPAADQPPRELYTGTMVYQNFPTATEAATAGNMAMMKQAQAIQPQQFDQKGPMQVEQQYDQRKIERTHGETIQVTRMIEAPSQPLQLLRVDNIPRP